jgi:hypothetical protein
MARSTPATACTPVEHAGNAARKGQHERDQDTAQPNLPVVGVPRDHGVEELVGGGADQRAGGRSDAAEQHHDQRLNRHRRLGVHGEDAALEEDEDRSGETGEEARDDEGRPLEGADVDADGLRPPRVVPHGPKREAKGRGRHEPEQDDAGPREDERPVVVAHR